MLARHATLKTTVRITSNSSTLKDVACLSRVRVRVRVKGGGDDRFAGAIRIGVRVRVRVRACLNRDASSRATCLA